MHEIKCRGLQREAIIMKSSYQDHKKQIVYELIRQKDPVAGHISIVIWKHVMNVSDISRYENHCNTI